MRHRRSRFLLFPLLIALGSLHLPAQTKTSPARQRVDQLVELINAGAESELEQYLQDALAERMRQYPMSMHLRIMSDLHDRGAPWRVGSVDTAEKLTSVVLLQGKAGQWIRLDLGVEADGDHKIAGIGISPATAPPPPSKGDRYTDAEIRAAMDTTLDALHEQDRFSGAVLVARGDETIYSAVRGEANKDFGAPNTITTKFNLGSMNKMFTAVAIAQLVEHGKLAFDDPLSKFLPEFPDAEAAKKIRIEHLLTHTSGLGSYFNDEFMRSSRAKFRTVEDLMSLAADETLRFEPGSRWTYSNTGFLVLGRVIEVVTGRDYHDYIRERVTGPAGMDSTDCYELDRVNPNLAVGYLRGSGPDAGEWRNNIFAHVIRGGPAGGGYSTVGDLVRFAQALRAGRLLEKDMFRRVTSAKPELGSPEYGYGFGIEPGGSVGHSGGFPGINSRLLFWPDGELSVAVMSNYSGGAAPVVQQLRVLLRDLTK